MTEFIPKGTTITCPRKGHRVAVLKRDIRLRDPIKPSDLDFEPGQERVAGELMRCTAALPSGLECCSFYIMAGCIHTRQGWLPVEPTNLHLNQSPKGKIL